MEKKRRRSSHTRGATTVEWIIIIGLVALPFGAAALIVAHHLVPYYGFIEQMNGLPLP